MQSAAQTGSAAAAGAKPKARAITGFVRLDHAKCQKQTADALVVLRKVKVEFESVGYEVETLRLATQPLAELVGAMPEEQAFAFLLELDKLSVKENLLPNAEPAMLDDSDDRATMHLLEAASKMSPESTTRSASLPGSIDPFTAS